MATRSPCGEACPGRAQLLRVELRRALAQRPLGLVGTEFGQLVERIERDLAVAALAEIKLIVGIQQRLRIAADLIEQRDGRTSRFGQGTGHGPGDAGVTGLQRQTQTPPDVLLADQPGLDQLIE